MKSKVKKLMSVCLSVLLLLGAVTVTPISALAAENGNVVSTGETITSGDFKYEIDYDDTATITGYTGTATELTIPSELDGIAVTGIGYYAFSGCTLLTNVIIPDSVTDIEYNSFSNCTSLKSITIPDSVTYIDSGAFYGCTSLVSVIIPDSVTDIDSGAFYGCTSLTNVTLPETISSIGRRAFYNCPKLKSVTIPGGVNFIDEYAFGYYEDENYDDAKVDGFKIKGYSGVQAEKYAKENGFEFVSLGQAPLNCIFICSDIEEDVTEIIRYNGFEENLVIPSELDGKTVTNINWNAFSDCTSLVSVTIPDSVTGIGSYAFSGCTSLASVTIPEEVTRFDYKAFYDCPKLKSVTIPAGVDFINGYAFGYYEDENYEEAKVDGFIIKGYSGVRAEKYAKENGFEFVSLGQAPLDCIYKYYEYEEDSEIEITNYNGLEKNLTIPSEIDGKTVVRIGWDAFYDCTSLVSVIIPDSVTYIDNGAFSDCTSLTGITIPDSVTYIGWGAFSDCTSLTSVTIPDSVTEIDCKAFYNCPKLKSVTIPGGVDFIDEYAFGYYEDENYDDAKVDGFKIKGYSGVQAEKYAKDNGFEFVSLGQAPLKYVYKYVDLWDDEIEITRYNGLEKNLTIPSEIDGKTVVRIGWNAFYDCTSLVSVIIPDSVTYIDNGAFSDCTSLVSVTIPDSVTGFGSYAFSGCTNLASVTIPDSVTSIGYKAFYNCPKLKSVTIPGGVDYIYEYAFGYCDDENYDEVKIDGFKIKGYSGVQAEKYAKDNGFEFVSLGQAPLSCIYKYDDLGDEIEIKRYNGLEENLTIPSEFDGKAVVSIAWEAFSDCTSLTSVTIPDGVTYIDGNAFYGCTNLTSVTIPDSVTSIGWKAFYKCPNLKSVTIPADIGCIYEYAFGYCEDENYDEAKIDGFKITGYSGSEAERYAKDNGFEFISLGQAPTEPTNPSEPIETKPSGEQSIGDVDGDGKVNIKDATAIQKYAASLVTLTDEQKKAADVNLDGRVNINDATAIQKFVAGIDTGLSIGR